MFLCKLSRCHPERKPRGPSALACLGMTSRSAVPNEVRDASLLLGRTNYGDLFKTVFL